MSGPIELDVVAEGYLTWLALERGRSPRTIDSYRSDLMLFAAWCDESGVDPTSPEPGDLDRYVNALRAAGRAPATLARASSTLRGVAGFRSREMGVSDPTVHLARVRLDEPVPKALTLAQVEQLIESVPVEGVVGRRDRALLEVLYGTGMRVGEAVGMSCSDLDLDARLVRVIGKGRRERIVPIGRLADRALRDWLDVDTRGSLLGVRSSRDDHDAVFLNRRGHRLTRQGAWLVVSGRAVAAGLGDQVGPHSLRHSCATHMLEGGADVRVVQELLGHRSISTTQRYTRIAVDHLLEVYATAHPRALAGRRVPADVHGEAS